MQTSEKLKEMYQRLFNHYGPQNWWPAESRFEVMVGAILTQNTSWHNVEKALANLQAAGLLSLGPMSALTVEELAEHIRPAGYYTLKAKRLQNLFHLLNEQWGGDLDYFFQQPTMALREQLLSVKGIGPETADAIVLYAAEKPVFVVDNYTHRILSRHDIIPRDCGYYEIQEILTDNLDEDVPLFNEFHALLVQVGKQFCKKTNPKCDECPLQGQV